MPTNKYFHESKRHCVLSIRMSLQITIHIVRDWFENRINCLISNRERTLNNIKFTTKGCKRRQADI